MIKVTAAIIEKDGKILIARRRSGTRRGSKWEFPGGKIEAGETPEECLKRELMEELGIIARIGDLACSSKYDYGDIKIELLAYRVDQVTGEIDPVEHDDVKWVLREELMDYDLAPADLPIAERLVYQVD